MEIFEEMGLNYALWVWDPDWRAWNKDVNFMTFRFGADPENVVDVENDLQDTITEFWAINTLKPSSFAEQSSTPLRENWLGEKIKKLALSD